jgi:hypothetical protein
LFFFCSRFKYSFVFLCCSESSGEPSPNLIELQAENESLRKKLAKMSQIKFILAQALDDLCVLNSRMMVEHQSRLEAVLNDLPLEVLMEHFSSNGGRSGRSLGTGTGRVDSWGKWNRFVKHPYFCWKR